MGANNSKPQTVQMSNTSPFQISREVLERVEKATKADKGNVSTVCEHCSRTATPTATTATTAGVHTVSSAGDAASSEKQPQVQPYQQQQQQQMAISQSWARRSTEIEETQFTKTLDRVHNLFGQPIKWAKANECSADIENMEKQLISCYRQYGTEPLKCAQLAKQYHTFVFNKQVAAVKNAKSDGQGDGKEAYEN
ncbi:uncharacterized protein LOC135440911 [Drosophila montana]|uniref:uncharacterized protein LOC135440911 n=1 Tax=Drosophila montana TaxID=40370 RepID=UPI00313DD5D8